jgi:hypothetical protein
MKLPFVWPCPANRDQANRASAWSPDRHPDIVVDATDRRDSRLSDGPGRDLDAAIVPRELRPDEVDSVLALVLTVIDILALGSRSALVFLSGGHQARQRNGTRLSS